MLGVPPHRPATALGVHDDRGVGSACDRLVIGVEQKFVGEQIACMPAVDDQRCRAGAEVIDVLMKEIELIGELLSGKLQ